MDMVREKVAIVGAGNVGASLAFLLAKKGIADVVISDIVDGLPQGKGLDIMQSRSTDHHDTGVKGTNKIDDLNGCSVVVITAGIPRKPGMTREQLLDVNAKIMNEICQYIKNFRPQPVVIVVTNPLDVMTYYAFKITGFSRNRVFGMAGVLDSSRLAHFVAEHLGVSIKDVYAMILGSHGDTMVALPRFTAVSGIPITDLMSKQDIERIVTRTRDAGAEIVSLLKTGSAYYAPASSIALMVESIIKDENRVIPAAVYLQGEYGLSDVVIGVPVKIGEGGVKQIIELKLTSEELASLHKSAGVVKENISLLKI